MKVKSMLVTLAAGVAMLGTVAVAADEPSSTVPRSDKMTTGGVSPAQAQPLARASELTGKSVRDSEGQNLGKVDDIVLTADRSKIDYLAISMADHRDKLHAVALNDLKMTSDGSAFIFPMTRQDLDQRPTFQRGQWPESANALGVGGRTSVGGVTVSGNAGAGTTPGANAAVGMNEPRADDMGRTVSAGRDAAIQTRLVSKLIGMDVHGSSDQNICRIRDLIVSMDSGRIKEATVGVGGLMGMGEKYASIDWSTVKIPAGATYAQVSLTEDDLKKVAYSEKEYWQNAGFVTPEKKSNEPLR